MSSQLSPELVVRTTRIIVLALAAGLTGFIVFVVVGGRGAVADVQADLIGYAAAALVAASIVARFILPSLVAATVRRRILAEESSLPPADRSSVESQRLLEGFVTQLIVSGALHEGGGFLGAAAYMLGGNATGVVTAVVAALLVLTLFPTRDRVEDWLARERQALQLDRSLPR